MRLESLRWTGAGKCAVVCGIFAALWTVGCSGIVPILWDMGSTSSGSDAFGLVNRSNNTVSYPTIMQAMTRAVTSSYTLADIAKP